MADLNTNILERSAIPDIDMVLADFGAVSMTLDLNTVTGTATVRVYGPNYQLMALVQMERSERPGVWDVVNRTVRNG